MSFVEMYGVVRGSWVGAARLVGRYNTLLSVLGAGVAISFGALRGDPVLEPLPPAGAALRAQLRVCADPDRLPYSNDRFEGFENALALLVAHELGADVSYAWFSQRDGSVHRALNAGVCDVLIGVPASQEGLLTTRPYYRSSYVFVWRADRPWRVESFDDPILRELDVGVQLVGDALASAPPVHALSARGIVANVRGYSVFSDDLEESPPPRIIEAVASGEIEVAVAWGPLAGFYARRQPVALVLQPVPADAQIDPPLVPLPLAFDVSMGVRDGEYALRDRLDAVLAARAAEIDALLERFAVTRVKAGQPSTATLTEN
jgi:mxaJ protein